MTSHNRRSFAAALGAGLAAPGLGFAAPAAAQLEPRPDQVIVAAVGPQTPNAGQTIETANDPYRRMTAPVALNGKGPFFFVVDTGANQSVISRELASELGLPDG